MANITGEKSRLYSVATVLRAKTQQENDGMEKIRRQVAWQCLSAGAGRKLDSLNKILIILFDL